MVLVSRASALRSVMDRETASKELDRLIEKFPEESVIRRIKADLLGDVNTREALPYYEEALKLSIKNKGAPDPAIEWEHDTHTFYVHVNCLGVGSVGNRDSTQWLERWVETCQLESTTCHEQMMVKKLTKKWTIICAEQGIGDQILFMHSLNEAIEEFWEGFIHYRKETFIL